MKITMVNSGLKGLRGLIHAVYFRAGRRAARFFTRSLVGLYVAKLRQTPFQRLINGGLVPVFIDESVNSAISKLM